MSELVNSQEEILKQLSYYRESKTVCENLDICGELISRIISDLEIENKISLLQMSSDQYTFFITFLIHQLEDKIFSDEIFEPKFLQTLIDLFVERLD